MPLLRAHGAVLGPTWQGTLALLELRNGCSFFLEIPYCYGKATVLCDCILLVALSGFLPRLGCKLQLFLKTCLTAGHRD